MKGIARVRRLMLPTGESRRDTIILPRLDYQLLVIEVPPLRDERLDSIIPFRLRSLYPGSIETAEIDHRANEGAKRERLVFVTSPELLASIRTRSPKCRLLASSLLLRRAALKGEWSGLFWTREWAELVRFSGKRILSSIGMARANAAGLDFERLLSLDPPTGPVRITLVENAATEVSELEGSGLRLCPAGLGVKILDARSLRRRPAEAEIFPQRGRRHGRFSRALLAAFLTLDLILAALLPYRWTQEASRDLAAIQTAYEEKRASRGETASLIAELQSLEAEHAARALTTPPDAYAIIAEIASCLGPEDRILNLNVQGLVFRLEAEGPDALLVLERLDNSKSIEAATLLQSLPSRPGRERYGISGRYGND